MPPAKPKIARTAAARAKSGDFGAQLELFFANMASGKLTFMQTVVLVAITGVLAAGCVGAYLLMRSHVVVLSPSDTPTLKNVFYSGEPWLVQCTKGSKAAPMVYSAEGSLPGVRIGLLDCDALLPSGKTTYDRFKIRPPSYGPALLAAANTEKPQLAPKNVLTTPEALASWAKGATKAKMYAPTTSAQFDAQCVRKPWCLVVLTATGRLSDAEKRALQGLAQRERQLRVVRVDLSKSNLLLDLPTGPLPQPTNTQATVLLLREVEGEGSSSETEGAAEGAAGGAAEGGAAAEGKPVIASLVTTGLSDPAETSATVAASLASTEAVPFGFSRLVKRPALRPKRVAPTSSSKRFDRGSASKGSSEPASKTLTDEELKKLRAEREKAIKEAELNRRRKMAEEEASAANIVEEVDGGAEAEGAGGGSDASAFAQDDDGEEGGEAAEEDVEAVEFD